MTPRSLEWQLRNVGRGTGTNKRFSIVFDCFVPEGIKDTLKTGTENVAGREPNVPCTAALSTP